MGVQIKKKLNVPVKCQKAKMSGANICSALRSVSHSSSNIKTGSKWTIYSVSGRPLDTTKDGSILVLIRCDQTHYRQFLIKVHYASLVSTNNHFLK